MGSNSFIINSTFSSNKEKYGAIKIYNDYNKKSKSILSQENESDKSILFVVCSFEKVQNLKNLIDYVDEKSRNKVEVIDCLFEGKLNKGSQYISGINDIKFYNSNHQEIKQENQAFKNNDVVIKINNHLTSTFLLMIVFITLFSFSIFMLIYSHNQHQKLSNNINDEMQENYNCNRISSKDEL